MKETVFQHQFIERKYQLGCLHSLVILHQWVTKLALYDVLYTNFLTNNELEKVNILLQKNMYPKSVIDKQIKTFLDKQFTEDKDITSEIQKTLY